MTSGDFYDVLLMVQPRNPAQAPTIGQASEHLQALDICSSYLGRWERPLPVQEGVENKPSSHDNTVLGNRLALCVTCPTAQYPTPEPELAFGPVAFGVAQCLVF